MRREQPATNRVNQGRLQGAESTCGFALAKRSGKALGPKRTKQPGGPVVQLLSERFRTLTGSQSLRKQVKESVNHISEGPSGKGALRPGKRGGATESGCRYVRQLWAMFREKTFQRIEAGRQPLHCWQLERWFERCSISRCG